MNPPYTPTVHLPGHGGPQHDFRNEIVHPSSNPIRIRDLIYPDRYDLLSRAKYALYCRENRALWERNEMEFLRMVRADTTWGVETDMLTYMWQLWTYGQQRNYPGPHYEAFHADTRKFFNAMESLEANGWLEEGHIQVIYGLSLLPGIDGREPSEYARQWFMADAQHRLCCWLALFGQTEFEPGQIETLVYSHYRPFVTTPAFIEVGLLQDMAEFERELDEFLAQVQD